MCEHSDAAVTTSITEGGDVFKRLSTSLADLPEVSLIFDLVNNYPRPTKSGSRISNIKYQTNFREVENPTFCMW